MLSPADQAEQDAMAKRFHDEEVWWRDVRTFDRFVMWRIAVALEDLAASNWNIATPDEDDEPPKPPWER